MFGQIAIYQYIKKINPILIASFTLGIAFSGFFVSTIFNLTRRFDLIPEQMLIFIFSAFYIVYLILLKLLEIYQAAQMMRDSSEHG